MNKRHRQYKFINTETDNVIFYLSISEDEEEPVKKLEETRRRLAADKGVPSGTIYYIYIPDEGDDPALS